MKKTFTVTLLAIISVMIFCSCGEHLSTEQETAAITYADIYEANTYSAVTSSHSSVILNDCELVDGEYSEYEYYRSESGYAYLTDSYTDENGISVRDLIYLIGDSTYIYLSPMTADKATFDILDYNSTSGLVTEEQLCPFGLVSPEYNQTVTEYKKTDNGYEVTGENSDKSFVTMLRSLYFSEGEYAEGDKILFKFELNEKYEMLKYENYYVFADGSEPIKITYGEFIYDSDSPDFMNNANSIIENDAKDISVQIYTGNGVIERKVYSDYFLIYTDYEVYSDAEYTDLLTTDIGYYWFTTDNDITLYIKE